MKHLKLLLVLAPVFGLVVMTSCSKSNNNSTPAAKDSVFYSPWINLTATFSNTDSLYEQVLAAPAITQTILDQGTVMTYIKDQSGEIFTPQDVFLFPTYTVGDINLFASSDFTSVPFRYIVIPGTIATTSTANGVVSGSAATFSSSAIKKMSYAQLIKTFNIPAEGGSK